MSLDKTIKGLKTSFSKELSKSKTSQDLENFRIKYLGRNGIFIIEFGMEQEFLLKEELVRYNFNKFSFHKDFNNVTRLVCVKKDT